jgi:hypothetical protein
MVPCVCAFIATRFHVHDPCRSAPALDELYVAVFQALVSFGKVHSPRICFRSDAKKPSLDEQASENEGLREIAPKIVQVFDPSA